MMFPSGSYWLCYKNHVHSLDLAARPHGKHILIQELRQAVCAILKSPSLLPTIQTSHLMVKTKTEFWTRTNRIFALLHFKGIQDQLVPYDKAFVVNVYASRYNGVEIVSSAGAKEHGVMGGLMGKFVGDSVKDRASRPTDLVYVCQEGKPSCDDDPDPFASIMKCSGVAAVMPEQCALTSCSSMASSTKGVTTPDKKILSMVNRNGTICLVGRKPSLFENSQYQKKKSLSLNSPDLSIHKLNGGDTTTFNHQTQYASKLCGKSVRDPTNIIRRRLMAREAAMASPIISEEANDKLWKSSVSEQSSPKISHKMSGFTSKFNCSCVNKSHLVEDATDTLLNSCSMQVATITHLPTCKYSCNEIVQLPTGAGIHEGELLALNSGKTLFNPSEKCVSPKSIATHVSENVETRVSENVETRVSENVETRVSENVETRVSENVETRVSENVETRVSENVETRVSENVRMQVLECVKTQVDESSMSNIAESAEMCVLESMETNVSASVEMNGGSNVETCFSENTQMDDFECSAARCRPIQEYIKSTYCVHNVSEMSCAANKTMPCSSLGGTRTLRNMPLRKCKRETSTFVPSQRRRKSQLVDDRNWDGNYSDMAAVTYVNLSKLWQDLVHGCPVVVLKRLKEEPRRRMSSRINKFYNKNL